MLKTLLVAAIATAILLTVAPSVVIAATTVPTLPTDVDPVCIANANSECEHVTIEAAGVITLTGNSGLLRIVCDVSTSITYNGDGTSSVTAFDTVDPCGTNLPNCTVDVNAANLGWGDNLGYFTPGAVFVDYINVDYTTQFTGSCPVSGTFTQSGTLTPSIAVGGGEFSMSFGIGSGNTSGALGTVSWDGVLTGSSGLGPDTHLILL